MNCRNKSLNNEILFTNRLLKKNSINSSLISITKQLNNISINDTNILKFKNEKNRLNSKNRKDSTYEIVYDNNSSNNDRKPFKYKGMLYKNIPSFSTDFNDFKDNYYFTHVISFSIMADKNISMLNKNDLRKKNYILKENVKFLLNEIKKYKKNELTYDENQINEYVNKIENYINEINKYKKDIMILKEKYNYAIKENKELKAYIQLEINKLNNRQKSIHSNLVNSTTNRLNRVKKIKNIDLNLKNNSNDKKNINIDNYSSCTTKVSRNSKNIDLNIINNINSNKYLLFDDNKFINNLKENNTQYSNSLMSNSGYIPIKKKIRKYNTNVILNTKNNLRKIRRNNKNKINQIIFSRIENNKNKLYDNKINLLKNKISQNSIRNKSFELNKTINLSRSFRYYKGNNLKKLEKKNFNHNKLNNFICINNNTLQDL